MDCFRACVCGGKKPGLRRRRPPLLLFRRRHTPRPSPDFKFPSYRPFFLSPSLPPLPSRNHANLIKLQLYPTSSFETFGQASPSTSKTAPTHSLLFDHESSRLLGAGHHRRHRSNRHHENGHARPGASIPEDAQVHAEARGLHLGQVALFATRNPQSHESSEGNG
jgi:hypothetical protein